ncbi:MAG: gamma-glutamyl-phosphate reductase, partial [Eggerthellaceae bacterium]|nr:gamma-glutamyl-phosphate reductase [Eggerthellaceae bacterium]
HCAITSTDQAATVALMKLLGLVDGLIPRGGAGLINHCVENSKVPVIETGTGNCHIYVHESADPDKAKDIVVNAKCRRYGVCNAAESLLVDSSIANEILPQIGQSLAKNGVTLHCDDESFSILFKAFADDVE